MVPVAVVLAVVTVAVVLAVVTEAEERRRGDWGKTRTPTTGVGEKSPTGRGVSVVLCVFTNQTSEM